MTLLKIGFAILGIITLFLEKWARKKHLGRLQFSLIMLSAYSILSIIILFLLFYNHLNFPYNLDVMEGTVLQHVQRAATFDYIYVEPKPEYVPLAYNPLYYVISVPFVWLFGSTLFVLRLVSIIAAIGIGFLLFLVVYKKSGSRLWGLFAAGIFAASYQVMDAYIDNAHSDSWFIFLVLLGGFLISQNRSRRYNITGLIFLLLSFWFKQHGALFAIGGVLYLTWREGICRSWIYWVLAIIIGPFAFFLLGPQLFGPKFLYFTWQVPMGWSELSFEAIRRYLVFIVKYYPILACIGVFSLILFIFKDRKRISIWETLFVTALLSGIMGSMDPGSSDNVFIPMSVFFILNGLMGLIDFEKAARWPVVLSLFTSFALLLYNPTELMVSPRSNEVYNEFILTLKALDGPVFSPAGPLQSGYEFYPAAHWVALEDMIRGPGKSTQNNPLIRGILAPVMNPEKNAYIVLNYPLEIDPMLGFLQNYYSLDTDFGVKFQDIGVLKKHFYHLWPRYLYKYNKP
jgi:hypothetical protein